MRLDPETGLYLMGARYYDPEVGRFISADPIQAEDSLSPYVYAADNPVTKLDPSGLYTCWEDYDGRCMTKSQYNRRYRLPWKAGTKQTLTCGPNCGRHMQDKTNLVGTDLFATDWGMSAGTDVLAVSGGAVQDWGSARSIGKWIALRHADGRVSVYLHLQSYFTPKLKKGLALNRGALVGKSGGRPQDGCANCPPQSGHLHIHFVQAGQKGTWVSVKGQVLSLL